MALTKRQITQAEKAIDIVDKYGKYNQNAGGDGCHYILASENQYKENNISCSNCIYYIPNNKCQVVNGAIQEGGLCKLWIIPSDIIVI